MLDIARPSPLPGASEFNVRHIARSGEQPSLDLHALLHSVFMKPEQKEADVDPDEGLKGYFLLGLAGVLFLLASYANGWLAGLFFLSSLASFVGGMRRLSPKTAAAMNAAEAEAKIKREKSLAETAARDKARQKANAEKAERKARQQRFLDDIKDKAGHEPVITAVLGRGLPGFKGGTIALLTCRDNSLHISSAAECFDLPIEFQSLSKLEITGPGKSTSGGGFVGGGFGVEGATEGILISSILNVLTTHTKNETYLTIRFDREELILQVAKLSPLELRVLLSPAMVAADAATRARDHTEPSLSSEIERLGQLRREGSLTDEEFVAAKAALFRRG
jgi:hypothetical protein